MTHNPPVAIDQNQNPVTRVRQVIMTATQVLGVAAGAQQYHLGDVGQREALIAMINTMGYSIELPPRAASAKSIAYPVIVTDGHGQSVPVVLTDAEVMPFLLAVALVSSGLDAAAQISYRPGMLPALP